MCHHTPGTPLPFTMSKMEADLCQHENTLGKSRRQGNSHQNHRTNLPPSANAAKRFRKPLQCLKCGGHHKLITCKHASDEEKKDLWEKFKKSWTTSTNGTDDKPADQAPAIKMKEKGDQPNPKTDSNNDPIQKKPDNPKAAAHNATAVIKSRCSKLRPLHWATMANSSQRTSHKYSEFSEWLIDSGCSNHMTPFANDLITDVSNSTSLVEVANGNIMKAPKKGTALIRIIDVQTHSTFDVLLEDVLYVPGLSRRLFSVTQWTQSGGSLFFKGTTCEICYDDDDNTSNKFSMQLYAPFSPQDDTSSTICPLAASVMIDLPSNHTGDSLSLVEGEGLKQLSPPVATLAGSQGGVPSSLSMYTEPSTVANSGPESQERVPNYAIQPIMDEMISVFKVPEDIETPNRKTDPTKN